MINNIVYDEDKDINIVKDTFQMTSDDNKRFYKTSYYMRHNIKFNEDILPVIFEASVYARRVLCYIIKVTKFGTNIVKINRKNALGYLGTHDYAVISKGLKELLELHIIEKTDNKDEYVIPMNNIIKGRVEVMMQKIEDEKREAEFAARQETTIKNYKELSNKRTLKLKLKRNE